MAGPTKTAEADRGGRDGAPHARVPSDAGPPPPRPRLRPPGSRTVFTMMLLAIALGGFGVWAVYGSNWLLVERVSVSGARHLTDQQVRQAAAVPTGEPVASVDRSAVERRVKKRLLRVAKAEAVRAWPHGIGLKVTERRAELVLKPGGPGAPYTEVDAEGVRFATVTTAPKGVPQLDMEEEQSSSVRHFGAARLRREAVRVASALPQRVAGDTETIRVRSYDSMTLDLKDGRSILWGSSERGAAKARVLTALMKASPEATHFDVSVPSAPASSES